MRRSIFHRHKPNKLADRLRPVGQEPIGTHEAKHAQNEVRKNFIGKNFRIGAILTLIAAGIALMSQKSTQPLPTTEQVLALPNSTAKTTNIVEQAPTIPTRMPPPPLPPINAVPVSNIAHNANPSTIGIANAQAIQSARNGDPISAVAQLESALLNDQQAGPAFDNLRRLYAGFATQSYQMAIDPNKNQAVIVELNDSQQKHNIQIPVMTYNAGNRIALTKTDNTQAMPTLPAASLPNLTVEKPTIAPSNNPTEVIGMPTLVSNNITMPIQTPTQPPIPEPVIKLPPPLTANERKEINSAVMQALKNWSEAWSKQDVATYLSSYSPTYAPKGTTHKDWAEYRQIRLTVPKFVKVELSDQKAILTDNTHVRVSFTQSYASDTLRTKDKKTLELELIDNTWLITSESGR
jgi:hypothetical protein